MDETECTGKTALLIGFQEGHDTLCKYLIKGGCDVNVSDHLGQSALYFAVHRSSPSMALCQKLIKYGYDVENDSDWLPKDLQQKFMKTGNGVFSRMLRKMRIVKPKINFNDVDDFLSDDYVDVDMSFRNL